MRSVLRLLAIVLGAIIVLAVIEAVRSGVERPRLYQLPGGFRGWVEIDYENPKCPPLASKGLYLAIVIPQTGRACTSGRYPYGWTFRKFDYLARNGARARLRSDEVPFAILNSEYRTEVFFVGTNAELKKSWGSEPKDWERRKYPWQGHQEPLGPHSP